MHSRLPRAVRGLLVLVSALLALATVLTQLAQALGWSFRSYAIAVALLSAAAIVGMARSELRGSLAALRAHAAGATVLALASTAAALLTLVSQRVLVDDLSYIPNVVHYVAHPDTAMSHVVHFIFGGDSAVESYYVGTSMPFEYAQGVVAYLIGVDVLSVYFVLAPALIGALIPLVWYYTLSRFEFADRAAIAGAVLICLCLPLMGEAHRGFGNYAFNRLWQGKAVLMTFGVPLVVGLSIDFLRNPGLRHWLCLFVAITAMVGTSTSSIALLVLLAPVLAVASVLGFGMSPRVALPRVAAFGAGFLYLVGFGLAFMMVAATDLGAQAPISKGFAEDFFAQAGYVFPRRLPTSRVLALASCAGVIVLLRGWQRRFFASWLAFVSLAYLNPYVAPWLLEYVTPPTIYWRLFYLLPFPLAIGLTGAFIAERAGVGVSRLGNGLAAAVVILLIAAHVPSGSTSIFQRTTDVGVGYRMDPVAVRIALDLIEATPPGPMLAPWRPGGRVAMLSADRPQVVVRDAGLALWFTSRGKPQEADLRRRASNFLWNRGGPDGDLPVLKLVRRYRQIKSVVALQQAGEPERLRGHMALVGFTESQLVGPFTVFTKPQAAGESGAAPD